MAGAVPRVVTLHAPDWRFDPRELEAAFTDRTRVLLLNTPHNPTGKVFSREELEALAALCRRYDPLCITDEVYEHLVYEGRHVPMATLPGMRERTITISSFGKTFSLTGWKIGWAAAPPELTAAVRAAHQFLTFATATPLQHARPRRSAPARSPTPSSSPTTRPGATISRGSSRVSASRSARPRARTSSWPTIPSFGFPDDVAFCRHLAEKVGVAAIPPSVFYDHPYRPTASSASPSARNGRRSRRRSPDWKPSPGERGQGEGPCD